VLCEMTGDIRRHSANAAGEESHHELDDPHATFC
jgi:hypothetical protein